MANERQRQAQGPGLLAQALVPFLRLLLQVPTPYHGAGAERTADGASRCCRTIKQRTFFLQPRGWKQASWGQMELKAPGDRWSEGSPLAPSCLPGADTLGLTHCCGSRGINEMG